MPPRVRGVETGDLADEPSCLVNLVRPGEERFEHSQDPLTIPCGLHPREFLDHRHRLGPWAARADRSVATLPLVGGHVVAQGLKVPSVVCPDGVSAEVSLKP